MKNISKHPSKISSPREQAVLDSQYQGHFRDTADPLELGPQAEKAVDMIWTGIEEADSVMNMSLDTQVLGVPAPATLQVQVGSHISCVNPQPSAIHDTEIVPGAAAGTKLTVKKRLKKDIRPRQGGMDGEFIRMISKEGLPGVTVNQVLGLNPKGMQIKLEPSKLQKDYVAIDSRALYGVYPSEGRRGLSEVVKLVSQISARLDINSKSDVGEARSWLKYAKDPITGAITSVPAPQYFSGLTGKTCARTSMYMPVDFPIPTSGISASADAADPKASAAVVRAMGSRGRLVPIKDKKKQAISDEKENLKEHSTKTITQETKDLIYKLHTEDPTKNSMAELATSFDITPARVNTIITLAGLAILAAKQVPPNGEGACKKEGCQVVGSDFEQTVKPTGGAQRKSVQFNESTSIMCFKSRDSSIMVHQNSMLFSMAGCPESPPDWSREQDNTGLASPTSTNSSVMVTRTRRNSLLHNPIKTKRILCDKDQESSLSELEKPFSDNFTAQVIGAAGTNSRGLPNTSMDTMHMICKSLGWKSGKNADDCMNKYYITPCNQPKTSQSTTASQSASDGMDKSRFNSKLKISTADIPIVDVYAAYDAIQTVTEKEWRTKLESKDMREVGNLIELLKRRHPEAKVFKNNEANIPRALELAALYVLPIDQDVTVDLAGSPNIPKLKRIFEEMGDTIAETTIGHNGFKTELRETSDRLQYTVMVYDKLCETYQQSGKSKERTLDSKVHRLVNPSTTGLKKRFAHQEYQENGDTRVEISHIGLGWTEMHKNMIIQMYVAVVRTGLVSKSIHDHLADTELFLDRVTALYLPEVHTLKTKALRNTNQKARNDARNEINRVPEGAVSYWKTGTTGKRIGHVIASDVNLVKGSTGFPKMMSSLAFESPCNLDINFYSVVDGFDEFMDGGTPTIWLRHLILEKKADTEQCNSMYVSAQVCKGAGLQAETDIATACGVTHFLMSHLKLAVKKEDPTFQNTSLYLQPKGTASVIPVDVAGRTFFGKGSLQNLPDTYVNVTMVEDRKGLIGKPSKTNKSFIAFQFQGEKIRFPDQYQNLLRDYYQTKTLSQNPDNYNVRVRYSASNGFEYEILSASPLQNSLVVCQQGKAKSDRDLPVQAEPMKILNIHRTKRFRGFNLEIELEHHGRFMGPPTTTKNLIELMKLQGDIGQHVWQDKDDQQSRVDLSSKGYFLGHTTSVQGPVRGGKGRNEEWIQFIKDDGQGKREVVLESEGTKHAYKKRQPERALSSEPEPIEPRPAKRTKQSSNQLHPTKFSPT